MWCWASLALDGSLMAVAGALPAAIAANGREMGLICPKASGAEAAWAGEDIDILAPDNLIQLINHVKGTQVLSAPKPALAPELGVLPDLRDIKGQEVGQARAGSGGGRRASSADGGAARCGQVHAGAAPALHPAADGSARNARCQHGGLARRRIEGWQAVAAQAVPLAPSFGDHAGTRRRRLRAKPGEMALAHHGVLFLDELPEFQPRVLESLRQPLETGETVVARANYHVTYPAQFQLVAAMNPCKCGMAGEPGHTCRKGPRCASDYQARISGPLLDRMDIQIELPAVSIADLTLPPPKETSADVAVRVAAARLRQKQRFEKLGLTHLRINAQADGALLEEIAQPDSAGLKLMRDAADAMGLSARGYHRVLRVARTLADLDGREQVARLHIAEALSYRQKLAAFQIAAEQRILA